MSYMITWVTPDAPEAQVKFVYTQSELKEALGLLGIEIQQDDVAGQGLGVAAGKWGAVPVHWRRVPTSWLGLDARIRQFAKFGADKGEGSFANGQAAAYKHAADRMRELFTELIEGR